MTVHELLRERLHSAEVADRRVQALRLAATVGRAREFHEREVQRVIDSYERIVADPASYEPPVGRETCNQVGSTETSYGGGAGI